MTQFVLGGGCFWCLDAVYRQIKGVTASECGYAGGSGPADYYRVATGTTGYAEVVRVTFDESIIPADTLLDIYFLMHNPTTPDRQGADIGTQYRSIMLYTDEQQKTIFQSARDRAQKIWDDPIVTQITHLEQFHIAESEHQNYFANNPDAGYCTIVIEPKISKVRSHYAQWFKKEES